MSSESSSRQHGEHGARRGRGGVQASAPDGPPAPPAAPEAIRIGIGGAGIGDQPDDLLRLQRVLEGLAAWVAEYRRLLEAFGPDHPAVRLAREHLNVTAPVLVASLEEVTAALPGATAAP